MYLQSALNLTTGHIPHNYPHAACRSQGRRTVADCGISDVRLSKEHTPFLRLNGKGEQERVVYLSAAAAQLLDEYLRERPQDGPNRSS